MKHVMKENQHQQTALHFSSAHGHEKIVKSLLNAFSVEDKQKLIEYLMKKDQGKNTALHYSSANGDK